jgi:hypothetical protein
MPQTGGVDRVQLVSALDGSTGAAALCREDLEHGARLVVLPGLVGVDELRSVYRRRAEHLARQGTAAMDAFEAADKLDATTHVEVALGKVEGGPSGYFFQLFFDPQLEEVIACLAVPERDDQSSKPD